VTGETSGASGGPGVGVCAAERLDPALVEDLGKVDAYPLDTSARRGIEHVQTHLSHLFLTAERVYKLHKAVHFDFVDFATRASRNADSLREVQQNRRLAPDVYLGVAPLVRGTGGFAVSEPREALARAEFGAAEPEHCVVMRRLPDGRDALSLLARGALQPAHVERLAARIAEFHAAHGLGTPAPFTPAGWLARCVGPVQSCCAGLDEGERLRARVNEFAAQHAARFEARRQLGRAVDGHGDLHLAHLWFERDDAAPLAIDCLAFREDLHRIDAACDVAFLAMDLAYRERRDLGERFVREYAAARDDFDLYLVLDFFVAYRAAVRGLVAQLAARDGELPESQRAAAAGSAHRHVALAERALEPPQRAAVVAMAGLVGSGKSTVARRIAEAVGGVVIASDRVRKAQAGLEATARGHSELYTAARSDAVYAGLLERADSVCASGRVAVLDATYARAAERRRLMEWAEKCGSPAFLCEVRCAADETLRRLAARAAQCTDPSDAGPELYAQSAASFEPTSHWPRERRAEVDTDGPNLNGQLSAALARFGVTRS
jgi:hypothetical protein